GTGRAGGRGQSCKVSSGGHFCPPRRRSHLFSAPLPRGSNSCVCHPAGTVGRGKPDACQKFDSPPAAVYHRRVETQTQSAPVTLRGTGRGLEIFIEEGPPLYEVIAHLEARLAHAPSFVAGAQATVWLAGGNPRPGT